LAPKLFELCAEEECNPVMAKGWRWKAPELMSVCPNEEEQSVPRVTTATDVWAFAITIVEVHISTFQVLPSTKLPIDLHRIRALLAHQTRHQCHYVYYVRRQTQAALLSAN
jgi:hypothetical protein